MADDEFKFNIGDLVGWNGENGAPPWYIDEIWENTTHGIIYKITTAEGTVDELISYMVYWNNDMIFPAWYEELILICAGKRSIKKVEYSDEL